MGEGGAYFEKEGEWEAGFEGGIVEEAGDEFGTALRREVIAQAAVERTGQRIRAGGPRGRAAAGRRRACHGGGCARLSSRGHGIERSPPQKTLSLDVLDLPIIPARGWRWAGVDDDRS